MVYNRKTLRTLFRTFTGAPDNGTAGDARLNMAFNFAAVRLHGDLPSVLKAEEHRFRLEVPIEDTDFAVDPLDPRVFTTENYATGHYPHDGTLSGRRVEIWKDNKWHQRIVREVYGGKDHDTWVVDKPWLNNSDTALSWRCYTPGYPYPADVEEIQWVGISDETGIKDVPEARHDLGMLDYRASGVWRDRGDPTLWSRGDYVQLPAPHVTPDSAVVAPDPKTPATWWGFDNAGTERDSTYALGAQYGAAGTFSYAYCLALGRRSTAEQTRAGNYHPFWISAPSEFSTQQTTTWAGGRIHLNIPNHHYLSSFGPNPLLTSFNHSGLEVWWFRCRHATEDVSSVTNKAANKRVEADGIPYLWSIQNASTTTVMDYGQYDPVDQDYPLRDHHGHKHLVFDRLPETADDVVMSVVRRPMDMQYDTDVMRLPPECVDAFIHLTEAFFLSKRSGEPDKESSSWAKYQAALQHLADQVRPRGALRFQSRLGLGERNHRLFTVTGL